MELLGGDDGGDGTNSLIPLRFTPEALESYVGISLSRLRETVGGMERVEQNLRTTTGRQMLIVPYPLVGP